jgi:integrase
VEFNALIYLHRNIFKVEVQGINSLRARSKNRIPPILTKDQVRNLLTNIDPEYKLIAAILYGTGLRVNECLRLRLKDVDLTQKKLIIHSGKGDKERIVPLPESLQSDIQTRYLKSESLWKTDSVEMIGVHTPRALEQKYKTVHLSKDWYWLFPNTNTAKDPRTQRLQRHHIYDFTVQKAFLKTRLACKLPQYTTPHALRHAFCTHLTEDMLLKGFPREMIEVKLMEYVGHASKETLKWYIHLAAPKDQIIDLPIDSLFTPARA